MRKVIMHGFSFLLGFVCGCIIYYGLYYNNYKWFSILDMMLLGFAFGVMSVFVLIDDKGTPSNNTMRIPESIEQREIDDFNLNFSILSNSRLKYKYTTKLPRNYNYEELFTKLMQDEV